MASVALTSSSAVKKPALKFVQLLNMSFGFLGIQFGWDLQRANMGPIYEYLKASPDEIPMLFLAAPLTGLIVQPIIGYMSDRTWHPWWGRRRPYFFVGAVLSTICLFFMPNSSALWMAAGLLWILDTSGNIAMEPFRAFVADMLPEHQRTSGFAMQSFMIALGGSIASALPFILSNIFHVSRTAESGQIPDSVKYAFYIGASIFFAAVMYTILTTKEYPPTDAETKEKEEGKGLVAGIREINRAIFNMPKKMKQLALVQFFTWPGLFLMWFYYSTAVARNVFNAEDQTSPVYTEGVEFAGLTLAYYNVVAFLVALFIPFIARKLGRKLTHSVCLLCGAIGLISVGFVTSKNELFLCMTGVGIAWTSILSMPYAMLAGALPEHKIGVYMGIFNFFIVLPEIIASLFFGWIMQHLLNNDRMLAVQIGGGLMILAGIICYFFVSESKGEHVVSDQDIAGLEIEEQRSV
ncbi:MFS transporter [Foetidibacter luteolus]|uniref:MFS transporter n=1 Tax=Foetidibacter luteolus TaxID=2608880 RepID=UPI00129B4519|nr:MFS transporter [Foetidibacter luteolus]